MVIIDNLQKKSLFVNFTVFLFLFTLQYMLIFRKKILVLSTTTWQSMQINSICSRGNHPGGPEQKKNGLKATYVTVVL